MNKLSFKADQQGWLSSATHIPSPNCNERPDAGDISLLVIHNISLPPGEFSNGCVEQFFCNQLDHSAHPYFQEIEGVEVSAHFLISREGEVVQFVPLPERAWHAGVSCFEGRDGCNDFSIGIELEGTDSEPYSNNQYRSLIALTRTLMQTYPQITRERIVGHSDIAPGRKTDPGPAFDWARFKQAL